MQNLKENFKQTVGTVLVPLMPKRVERLTQEAFSMTVGKRNLVDGFLRAGIAQKMLKNSEHQQISDLHRKFWEHENCLQYHHGFRELALQIFTEQYIFIVAELNALLAKNPEIDTLIEIGCGGGSILNHLVGVVEGIERYVGVDLSAEIIAENKELFPDPRIEWVAGNAQTWIEQNSEKNTVYFSFRGVLEYFTQEELTRLYSDIAAEKGPAIFISMEPMALDHSYDQHTSRPYGTEYSWSHNYPHLYKSSGFTLQYQSDKSYDDHKICSVVATVDLKA